MATSGASRRSVIPGTRFNGYSAAEREFLTEIHPLARLATVGPDGTPHVAPLGIYWLDDATGAIVTSGRELTTTKKWRDVLYSRRAAIVMDDVLPPWRPRGIEIRGHAEAVAGEQATIWIYPGRVVSWGLEQNDIG